MALTRDFKRSAQTRAQPVSDFQEDLLTEGVECLISGNIRTGNILLRDYIEATIGFDELAALTDTPSKTLKRIFDPDGDPKLRSIFEIVRHLQRRAGVHLAVNTVSTMLPNGEPSPTIPDYMEETDIPTILAVADAKFDKGESVAGSSLIWQASRQATKNIAKRRGLPAETDDDLSLIISQIDAEYGYNKALIASYGVAEIFKQHVIHDILEDWEIEECRELVDKFFEYMQERLTEQQQ